MALRPGSSGGGTRPKSRKSKEDLDSLEGLVSYAKKVGLEKEVNKIVKKKDKLSFLQRLGTGLGAFNTAEAVLASSKEAKSEDLGTRLKSTGTFLGTYGKGIARGLGAAITGKNLDKDRRSYKDVAEELGIENKIAKFGIGFVGDVLLDPTTYFGGAMAKGLTKGVGKVTNATLKGVGRVAPDTEKGLRLIGSGLKDATGRAFVSGYKASKGALTDTLTFLSKRDRAKFGLATSNLARLGAGALTEDQKAELATKLIAGKRAEFIARESGKAVPKVASSTDPVVQKAIEAQKARTSKFGSQLNLENPYETYFPFIKKEKLENFLKETTARNIRVGSEGYKKQFKNLLTDDVLEMDPAKAFFTSEAAQVTDRMTRDFLKGFTEKYGVPFNAFNSADEAAKAGYRMIKEKGMFGKELGWVSTYDAEVIKNMITPEFQTISMLAKATGFDALTNLFKRAVTGLFLPFHVRNYASGMIQNFEALGVASLNPKTWAAAQKFAYHLGRGTTPSGISGKAFKAFKDRFGSDTFYQNEFLQAVDYGKDLKSAQKILSKGSLRSTLGFEKGNVVPLLGQDGVPFKAARAVGQFIEHQQKAAAYLAALGQGKNIPDALALAERAGFDYRNLTAFESQIMRRIIPFYSFTRKNIELQLRTLGENPERINQVLSFFENMGDRVGEDEKKSLPSYIKASLGIKLEDAPNGIKRYISSFGTPIEAFAELLNGNPVLKAISMTNPILKAPIEIGIGKDSFRQKDLKDVYDASEYSSMPKFVQDMLDIKKVQKDVLEKQPNGKLKKVGERTVYVADPVKLLIARSLFTSRGVTYLDQVFGSDLEGKTKFLKLVTGIKPQQVDLELNDSVKESKQKQEVIEMLKRYGEGATFNKFYVPK